MRFLQRCSAVCYDNQKLEEFKTLLIEFYEKDDDAEIIEFMKNYCIKKYDRDKKHQRKKQFF